MAGGLGASTAKMSVLMSSADVRARGRSSAGSLHLASEGSYGLEDEIAPSDADASSAVSGVNEDTIMQQIGIGSLDTLRHTASLGENLSKENIRKAQYYPDQDMGDIYPQIMGVGFLKTKDKFALALCCDPGVLQLCDPFSLQPFIALIIPSNKYMFLEHFMFH